jgi:spoIIIJ-associated protein
MDYVEAEGHSIDDAIERALQRLGVSRDKVEIEIVSNSTRGLFGLGGRRAKVRATLRRRLAVEAPGEPAPRSQASTSCVGSDLAGTAPPRPVSIDPAPQGRPVGSAENRRATAVPDRAVERRRSAPRRVVPPAAPRPRSPERPPQPVASPPRGSVPPPAELDAVSLERVRGVLAEIVRLTGSDGTVEVARDPDGARLVITGDPSGVLIGRRGQVLDALEYVVNRILAHGDEPSSHLVVDLEGYRQRRRQALEQLARRVAERARRRGKPVTLDPMSPRDRRIVHLALQDDPTLTTRSAGTGFYRKIVIVPAAARRPNRAPAAEKTE